MSTKVMILWGFLVLTLVITIAYLGIKQEANKDYLLLEKTLKESVKKYIEVENKEIPFEITSEELIEKEYLDNFELNNKECSATVKVQKVLLWNNYKMNITCSEKNE